jgi:PPOX class probable F420-dependent enzyme
MFPSVDDAILRQRLDAARVGYLATTRPDGRPHVVPCCFALAGDVVYSAVDAKPKSTLALQRLRNLDAHPAASLVVDHYDEDWTQLWWIRLDGAARVVESGPVRDAGIAALAAKYAQYVEAPPPGSVIAFDVDAWRAWP